VRKMNTQKIFLILCFTLILCSILIGEFRIISAKEINSTNQDIQVITELKNLPEGDITDISISPDENTIAISYKSNIYLYNMKIKEIKKLSAFKGDKIENISYSYKGRYLAVKAWNGSGIYDLHKSTYHKFKLNYYWGIPTKICITRDEKYVFVSVATEEQGNEMVMFELRNLNIIKRLPLLPTENIAVNTQKKLLYSIPIGETRMSIYDYRNDKERTIYIRKAVLITNAQSHKFIDNSIKYLIIVERDKIIKSNLDNFKKLDVLKIPQDNYFPKVRQSKDGKIFCIISMSCDSKNIFLYVFDIENMKILLSRILIDYVYDVSPSGKFLIYIRDNKIIKMQIN